METPMPAAFLAEVGAPGQKVDDLESGLQAPASRAAALYGPAQGRPPYANYAGLQDQTLRELRILTIHELEHRSVQEQVRELHRRTHVSRSLETIRGVGEDGASAWAFFIGNVKRFASQKKFQGWSGMVPESDQSGTLGKKGLRVTKAGPDLVMKYAYINNAEAARQWDPQIAAIYYDQMLNKGKHHVQAVCHCATHLLDRVRAVLRNDRPYELRDVDGTPVTRQEARSPSWERFRVPEEVRKRSRARHRHRQRDRRADRKQKQRRGHFGESEATSEPAASTEKSTSSPST